MSTTKVLHVIARMNIGGTAKYVGDLVTNIEHSELATGHVQGAEVEDQIVNNLHMHRIPSLGRKISPIRDLKAWLELRRVVDALNPEIIHTHTFKAGLIGRLVPGRHRRIHTFHGHLFEDQSFSKMEKVAITFVERYLARRTDLLISVGERVGQELRDNGIGDTNSWISIPPGVTPLVLPSKKVARTNLDLNTDSLLVGWMARVTTVKNPLLFLEVAKALPDINFVMAGGGDLLKSVRERSIANVKVLGWVNASDFWSAVDMAVSTSDNEGVPIALIEAQMAGVPVIATNVGSVDEVIHDGVTGFLTERNVASIVSALQILTTDRSLLAKMSSNASKLSSEKFRLQTMLESHRSAYRA